MLDKSFLTTYVVADSLAFGPRYNICSLKDKWKVHIHLSICEICECKGEREKTRTINCNFREFNIDGKDYMVK